MTTTLYDYWRSSAAYRLRIAFGIAGIGYEAVPVDLLTGAHQSAENLARNPQGLVPTVEIDGHTLTQSLAIIEYLGDAGHYNFLPEGALEKARVRALSYAIAMEIHPVCNLSVAKFAATNSGGEITMESWMRQFIPKGLKGFEDMLQGDGTYCFGDNVTLADLCLVPQIYNANRWGVDLSPFPKTRAAFAALEKLDAVQAAHPDNWQPE
ncbi:maleylacetoacetate isomerase [Neptunicoccus cionae]|uniref:maleylacetoacetate isomerase n=1 Tax=Neptunicoccus cionae TaxID=2035344 RepID=UPI000C75C928|nr:maleylacetoacetate isomerase [Amylibacter cionae]PLS19922.1 maleylacetoacetate isomerase [Amylibacter cionae]